MRSGVRIERIMPADDKSNEIAEQANVNETGSASEPTEKLSKAGCGKRRRGGQRVSNLAGMKDVRITGKSPIRSKNKLGLETSIARDIYALENEYSNRKKFPIPLSRIIMMAGELGGYKYGKFGLLSYLTHIMEKDYKTYCNLLAKCVNSMDRVSLSELGLTEGNKRVRLEIVGLSESVDSDKPTTAVKTKMEDNISLKESKEKVIDAEFVAIENDDSDSQDKDSR